MRSEQEINSAIDRYADTVRRLCVLHLKNSADTEDIFQTVFLKYALHAKPFESEEHEKAWFIRVTINACKDLRWTRCWSSRMTARWNGGMCWRRCWRWSPSTVRWYTCIIMRVTLRRRSVRFWGEM